MLDDDSMVLTLGQWMADAPFLKAARSPSRCVPHPTPLEHFGALAPPVEAGAALKSCARAVWNLLPSNPKPDRDYLLLCLTDIK